MGVSGPPSGQYPLPLGGVTTRPAESLLSSRAADFLAAGPASAATLIASVCQLPAVPGTVAEHMAAALFAGRREFARGGDGMWRLAGPEAGTADATVAVRERPAATYNAELSSPLVDPDHIDTLSYTVIDVETTGGSPDAGHRVTEIAAVRVENGEVRDTFQTLINPERSIPPFITSLTSISWEMVKDAPKFRDICDELLARMEGTIFVAHNAAFDWRFVSAEVARLGCVALRRRDRRAAPGRGRRDRHRALPPPHAAFGGDRPRVLDLVAPRAAGGAPDAAASHPPAVGDADARHPRHDRLTTAKRRASAA